MLEISNLAMDKRREMVSSLMSVRGLQESISLLKSLTQFSCILTVRGPNNK